MVAGVVLAPIGSTSIIVITFAINQATTRNLIIKARTQGANVIRANIVVIAIHRSVNATAIDTSIVGAEVSIAAINRKEVAGT